MNPEYSALSKDLDNTGCGRRHSILHVSHNYFVAGGSDRYFFELGRLLEEHGHRVVPFCAADSRNDSTRFAEYFPKSVNTNRPGLADAMRFVYSNSARSSLKRLLADEPVTLAHLHIYYGKLTGSILRPLKEVDIPIVQTLHDYKLLCPVHSFISGDEICEACQGRNFWRAIPKRCNRQSVARTVLSVTESYVSKWLGAREMIDHFIGVCDFLSQKMIQYGLPKDKITTIHNFIDAKRYTPVDEPGKYLLYFGRLERTKGIYTLLDAMSAVPQVECVIAGDGRERAGVERAIQERNLSNVRFVGFISGSALHDLIRGSACTVIPSEAYENCPMSVLESLALARPVIGTDIGGIPELINDGVDGFIVRPGDIDSLGAALEKIFRDPMAAAEMGRRGREKIEQQFSASVHYERVAEVYEKVTGLREY